MLKCLFTINEYNKGLFQTKYTIWEQKHPIFLLQEENYQ